MFRRICYTCEDNFEDRHFISSINHFTGQVYSSWKDSDGAIKGTNEGDYTGWNFICEKIRWPDILDF